METPPLPGRSRAARGSDPHAPFAGEGGTAIIEFALVLPFVAVLCLGVIDLARAYSQWNAVKNAAREAAVYAQANPYALVTGGACVDPDNATYYALQEAGDDATVTFVPANGCSNPPADAALIPTEITVTVRRPFSFITPLADTLIGLDESVATVTVEVQR